MQLRYDDALGSVDDESAVIGHQRHFAQIDFLFADVLDGLRSAAGLLIVDHEPNLDAYGCRVGKAAHLAFLDIEYRLTEPVTHIFKCRVA